MDVPKYRIVFAEPFESPLHLYERCEKIKADKKLSGYLIYTPLKISDIYSKNRLYNPYIIFDFAHGSK